jgi:hypothetical protein
LPKESEVSETGLPFCTEFLPSLGGKRMSIS